MQRVTRRICAHAAVLGAMALATQLNIVVAQEFAGRDKLRAHSNSQGGDCSDWSSARGRWSLGKQRGPVFRSECPSLNLPAASFLVREPVGDAP